MSLADYDETLRILKEHGAELVRSKRHNVWKFPGGMIFTTSQSPSDINAHKQSLRELKKRLGLTKHEATVGERREHRKKNRQKQTIGIEPARVHKPAWRAQLDCPEIRTVAANRIHLADRKPNIGITLLYRSPLTAMLRRLLA